MRDAYTTTWAIPNETSEAEKRHSDEDSVRWLDEDACKEIWKLDAKIIRATLDVPRSLDGSSIRATFSFLPTDGLALNHLKRTPCFNAGSSSPIPTKWGVALNFPVGLEDDNESDDKTSLVFATWAYEPQPFSATSTLIITRLRATKDTFLSLLSCVFQAAREHDMKVIKVWNLPKEFEDIAENKGLHGKTEERKEQLSCFKWYGPERNEEVHWAFNEKLVLLSSFFECFITPMLR